MPHAQARGYTASPLKRYTASPVRPSSAEDGSLRHAGEGWVQLPYATGVAKPSLLFEYHELGGKNAAGGYGGRSARTPAVLECRQRWA